MQVSGPTIRTLSYAEPYGSQANQCDIGVVIDGNCYRITEYVEE